MQTFDTPLHAMVLSEDGSYTAYSREYDEHYHSTKDGALHESFVKHVLPAFEIQKNKAELHILDICFGLGFNTLATLLYAQEHLPNTKLFLYSPELDKELVASLKNFTYPKEFERFSHIIKALVDHGMYSDDSWHVELFLGDAREYVRRFTKKFDIVYQDAFSPSANPLLWTQEYFSDIAHAMKDDGVLTTYSIALPIRIALHENGFGVYLYAPKDARKSTLASRNKLDGYEKVDVVHKMACNPHAMALRDEV
jgi:tRNA U34 5-methylaminomethyl-2-thiouridine-forming methyltransferase MnmC